MVNPLDNQSVGTLSMRSHSEETEITNKASVAESTFSGTTITMATKRNWQAEINKIDKEGEETNSQMGDKEDQSERSDQLSISSDITMATHNTLQKPLPRPKQPETDVKNSSEPYVSNTEDVDNNNEENDNNEDDDITMVSYHQKVKTKTPSETNDKRIITPAKSSPAPNIEQSKQPVTEKQQVQQQDSDSDTDDLPLSE